MVGVTLRWVAKEQARTPKCLSFALLILQPSVATKKSGKRRD